MKSILFEFFRFTGVLQYNRGDFLLIITRVKNILNYNKKRFRLVKVGGRDREREYLVYSDFLKERKKKESKQTSQHSHAKE